MAGHSILHLRTSRQQSPRLAHTPSPHLAAAIVKDGGLSNIDPAPNLVRRDAPPAKTSATSSTKSCAPGDTSPVCEKPVSGSSNTTIPIVLGVLLPLIGALVIFLVLHRRHVRKLRSEDANDRHKSLDFGMGDVSSPGGKRDKQDKRRKGIPEMSLADTEKTLGHGRGMSMDMDMSNPYLLPPELHHSRESLHSLSRIVNSGDDKYRPATTFIPTDGTASREGSTIRGVDDSSSYTASSRRVFGEKEIDSNQSLLHHAQRMSRSMPPTQTTSVISAGSTTAPQDPEQDNPFPRKLTSPPPPNDSLAPISSEQDRTLCRSDVDKDGPAASLRKSNDYLGAFIRSGGPSTIGDGNSEQKPLGTPPPSRYEFTNEVHKSDIASLPKLATDSEPLNFNFPDFADPVRTAQLDEPDSGKELPTASLSLDHEHPGPEQHEQDFDYDVRRLTMGMRPLPHDDPTEDPEQRAIRIRSFYKEYFDEAKPGPVYTRPDYHAGPESFHHGGPIHDASLTPYAQPIARRAMTPPPRRPSGFQAPERIVASVSGEHFVQAGPRAYSSASGRFGASNGGPPKRKGPPPTPLQVLPTPHMLKDDMIIPMDFAPPASFRERRAGTPDSPKGGLRPYSPALLAPLALASSFDDLAVMPSPHALRKSGTFTALEFAPPPRFRSSTDTRSDSGSIRSNRSGMSAAQLHSIRAGAYRVSRIPQDLGGTRQEFTDTLRPQWDVRK